MTSQESGPRNTPFQSRSSRRDDEHDMRPRDPDDLGVSASNRAVGITLAIGIGMMLMILMLPYIGG